MIFDILSLTSSAVFLGLALVTWAAMPKRDRESGQLASLACIVAGTLLAYCAGSLPLFALGWAITIVPYWTSIKTGPRLSLTAGTLALIAGALLHAFPGDRAHVASFAALMTAAIWRKGIFPLHSWVPRGFDESPILPFGLLINGHLGAFLIVRFAIPMLPDVAASAISFLSILALFTALYSATIALSEARPRRILGFLSVSQASFLLAGLESRNVEGVTGALVHWYVVAAATNGLVCVYRALEARYPGVSSTPGYLGLGNHAPRLAVFFALCGLALVGLPGTAGFAAEDLLFHGSLEAHPLLGITLPLATALNGITVYRLFSRLFMGRSISATPRIQDALPRERWALTGAVVFLIAGGLLPGILISARTPVAERIVGLLANSLASLH